MPKPVFLILPFYLKNLAIKHDDGLHTQVCISMLQLLSNKTKQAVLTDEASSV